ncbi:hypothetical protein [Mycetocola zhujimingii]|uniref:Uncharacterized protein n=1 Tax=Mycetocola zhujimingii TaxID=2079792 RepID=A0A2U1TGJ2_9MICO|nr:hypothetical protein [Mycetocola zhujimingii]AWB86461.1 hypothetical protein C3E77_07425 [Mycetocola zhujimingii]PWC08009.1 hypothetical protein DF223_01225 [Mycetocola zhujimingii]
MKNIFWLLTGIAAGFFVAHEINKTQKGKEFFSDLDGKLREFSDTVADAYREREAELREKIDELAKDAEDAIGDLGAGSSQK